MNAVLWICVSGVNSFWLDPGSLVFLQEGSVPDTEGRRDPATALCCAEPRSCQTRGLVGVEHPKSWSIVMQMCFNVNVLKSTFSMSNCCFIGAWCIHCCDCCLLRMQLGGRGGPRGGERRSLPETLRGEAGERWGPQRVHILSHLSWRRQPAALQEGTQNVPESRPNQLINFNALETFHYLYCWYILVQYCKCTPFSTCEACLQE